MYSKAVYKYELKEFKKSIVIYYGIITGILILLFVLSNNVRMGVSVNTRFTGIELTTVIFLFVCGMNSFKEIYHFSIQNGTSRKTVFISQMLLFCSVSAGMSIIDKFGLLIGKGITGINKNIAYTGMVEEIYRNRYLNNASDLAMHVEGLLFSICMYLAFLIIGFFITIAYYKMNKGVKIGVSVGLPVGLFIVMPIIEDTITNGKITKLFSDMIFFAFGYGVNPYYGMVTLILVAVVFSFFSWILMSKSVVHD